MPAEFDCEGCGYAIVSFVEPVPTHGLCAVCAWLCEFETPERIMELRRCCEPGGWESERQRRREQRINAP
jgi:hypothetical protein